MIKRKDPQQIEQMKAAGALSKAALRLAGTMVVPGVTTLAIDQAVENYIRLHGGKPTFKGYQGWVGDNAWTFYCGEPSEASRALCEVTRDCLKAGIEQAVPGNRLGDIGAAIQELAESNGFGVVRDYVGHGVGREMHEDPEVRNYGKRGRGVKLQPGMVIAIEPMITMGSYDCRTLGNGWTVVTCDGGAAAHYENTVAITADGPVILTADDQGPWCPMQGGEQ